MPSSNSLASAKSASVPEIASAIDLGTNTVLMVTGYVGFDGRIQVIDDAHAIARLGEGVDSSGAVADAAVERVCNQLTAFHSRARSLGARAVHAFGTSALRDAANSRAVASRVFSEVGVELCEISSEDEALLTFEGAVFGLSTPSCYAVLDIGGGSTELAEGCEGELRSSASVNIGAVRITERCFPKLPPPPEAVGDAESTIAASLEKLIDLPEDCQEVIAVAGTATTLAALDARSERFDDEELNGRHLTRHRVGELCDELLSLSLAEIKKIPQISLQRADIIGAGSLILRCFLDRYRIDDMTVSTRGIRYALLSRMLLA